MIVESDVGASVRGVMVVYGVVWVMRAQYR